MPRIAQTLALGLGLFGAVIGSQGPEFAQQYRQRLGGAIDELDRIAARFDEDARGQGLTHEQAIERLRASQERLTSLQGDAMRAHLERLERLRRQREAFRAAGPFERLFVLARNADTDIAQAAYGDFEPAMPVTNEGFAAAALGFALAWALSRMMGMPMRRMLFRRRHQRNPSPVQGEGGRRRRPDEGGDASARGRRLGSTSKLRAGLSSPLDTPSSGRLRRPPSPPRGEG